ncbi:metal-dependent hydrolase [Chloroflexota bacterium]
MLLFGHIGITLGTAVLLDTALSKSYSIPTQSNQQPQYTQQTKPPLLSRIDLRLLLIGALLPDIIDKPVGNVFFQDTFSNGRIFCHTFLFLLLITLAAFYLNRHYGKPWLLVLSFGTFIHLILDQMWMESQTLLWPLYGFAFEKMEHTHLLEYWFRIMHTKPDVYIPEIIGGGILIGFLLVLVRHRNVCIFIRSGKIYTKSCLVIT